MLGEVLTVFGRPSIAVTVLLVGIPSLEAVSQVLPVRAQHHDMQGAVSAEAFGQPIVPVRPTSAASGESVGRPLVSVARTIAMQGAPSSETVPAASVGAIIVMQGAASAASVTDLPLVPVGIASAFAAGGFTFYVPPQDQTLRVGGAAGGEDFGGWRAIVAVIAARGVATGEAFGPVRTAPQLRMAGVVSGEAVGRPSTSTFTVLMWPADSDEAVGLPSFPSPQTVHVGTGAASGETFGELNWTRGIVIYPQGAATGEVLLGPTFAFGGVSRVMQGAASAAVVGPVHYAQAVFPVGVDSSEAFGLPGTPLSVSPRGLASGEAVGRPDRPIAGGDVRQPRGRGKRGTHRRVPGADDPGGRSELGGVRPANGRSFHQPSWGRLLERVRPAAGRPDRAHRRGRLKRSGRPAGHAAFRPAGWDAKRRSVRGGLGRLPAVHHPQQASTPANSSAGSSSTSPQEPPVP
jgi:hypothetical protein